MERYSYPHTVENGAGERITFIRKVAGAGGERLEVESVVKPGAGPPMHIHRHQDAPRLAASATHTRTVAERLALFGAHDWYHIGQIGVVRRLLGKPAAAG